jgi:predicted RecB family nuclease
MRITSQLFDAFLKCSTKCHLRSLGESGSGNEYAEWVCGRDESYQHDAAQALQEAVPETERVVAPPATESLKAAKWTLAVDLVAQTPDRGADSHVREFGGNEETPELDGPGSEQLLESRLHAVERVPSEGRGKPAQFISIRFVFRNKLTKDDRLLLAFDALVLSQALAREISLGKIIHGDDHATLKVKTSALTGEVRKRVHKLAVLLFNPTPPDLVLNRHCAECEFQARCRKIATEKDDLSLLGGMSSKERQTLRRKGIFTITQLSYTFRPRRRPKRLRDKREMYHHSLKALAIREKKTHIVGSPELKIEGTPVYLDVESLPDRDFYYLIGLRIGNGESAVQHSLWADTVADEEKIWREFLAILETIEKPALIHYGSYETTFLKRMCKRYPGLAESDALLEKVTKNAVNLLAFIYGQVYFPTHPNGLKEVAGFIGLRWPEPGSTGQHSIMWRRQWEESRTSGFQQKLLAYNSADCEATESLSRLLIQLPTLEASGELRTEQGVAFVADKLPNAFSHPSWQTFDGALPELDSINKAAQWDYQRDRIYLRTQGRRRSKTKTAKPPRKLNSRGDMVVSYPKCSVCPTCLSRSTVEVGPESRFIRDLLFGRSLIKSRVVRHDFHTFWCEACRRTFGLHKRLHLCDKFGWNLIALYFYMVIDLGFQQRPVARLLERLFDIRISAGVGSRIKTRAGEYYEKTRQKLLETIARAHVVHADETKARIRGFAGYVWVFTTSEEVVYLYSESREAEMLVSVLGGFKGVLVSDFYSAYDSLDCPQQKCLIHLIRDLNNDVLGNPYDDELKQIVRDFGTLLKSIVEKIDRYGLKKHFLHSSWKSVARFYKQMSLTEYRSDAAIKLKLRFEKNHDKLFTFLNYDGVPWHNNNAEHAIKAYAKLRKLFVGAPTPKAVSEYLILLSICETCRYMGVDFLDFLRSGEKDIHAFAESRRGRKRRTQTSQADGLLPDAIPSSGSQP